MLGGVMPLRILESDMSQNQQGQQALKSGGVDPRMLPEYEALRAEINKLSHASRPEVDWVRIHQLASQIFEKHGVDLQTAIYFTLARSRIQGLSGFTEGCEFSRQPDRHPVGEFLATGASGAGPHRDARLVYCPHQ